MVKVYYEDKEGEEKFVNVSYWSILKSVWLGWIGMVFIIGILYFFIALFL